MVGKKCEKKSFNGGVSTYPKLIVLALMHFLDKCTIIPCNIHMIGILKHRKLSTDVSRKPSSSEVAMGVTVWKKYHQRCVTETRAEYICNMNE